MVFVGSNADDLVAVCDKDSTADPGWPAVSVAVLRGDDDIDDFTEDIDDNEEKDELCAVVVVSWALLGGRLGRELGE
jgi:hypothetical protein